MSVASLVATTHSWKNKTHNSVCMSLASWLVIMHVETAHHIVCLGINAGFLLDLKLWAFICKYLMYCGGILPYRADEQNTQPVPYFRPSINVPFWKTCIVLDAFHVEFGIQEIKHDCGIIYNPYYCKHNRTYRNNRAGRDSKCSHYDG